MTDNIDKLFKYIKDYSWFIAAIGGILLILNQTGFSINIPQYYSSLNCDGKIAFMGLINFIITILAVVAILRVIGRKK